MIIVNKISEKIKAYVSNSPQFYIFRFLRKNVYHYNAYFHKYLENKQFYFKGLCFVTTHFFVSTDCLAKVKKLNLTCALCRGHALTARAEGTRGTVENAQFYLYSVFFISRFMLLAMNIVNF